MSSKLEEKHLTNDTWKYQGYKRAREKEKKKLANRRKNKKK